MKFNKTKLVTTLIKYFGIILIILVIVMLVQYIKKIYKLTYSYEKYDKSIIAEVVDSKVSTYFVGSSKRHKKAYNNVVYTIFIPQTGEKFKVEDEFSNQITYKNGEKILLNYYKIYDKHSEKYIGKNYSIKPLYYFDEGSFFQLNDDYYVFYNSSYADKIINFEITTPNIVNSETSKDRVIFFDVDNHIIARLFKGISDDTINLINHKKSNIEITETSLGTVYNFCDNFSHYSILNYGTNLNESLELTSDIEDSINIIHLISDIKI